MINNTILVGRITKDPEVKKTNSGISIVSFTLAVNRQFNREETDFIRCKAWRNQAEFIGNYIKKGALLGVVGRIETGSYEDNTGNTIYTTEVVCESVQALEPKKEREANTQKSYTQPMAEYEEDDAPTLDIDKDDLPFR